MTRFTHRITGLAGARVGCRENVSRKRLVGGYGYSWKGEMGSGILVNSSR